MKQVAELDLLEVVGSKNRKKHVPTLHGDEEMKHRFFPKKQVEVIEIIHGCIGSISSTFRVSEPP